ncbi:Protein of unknown function, partial [Cotesia congregata]
YKLDINPLPDCQYLLIIKRVSTLNIKSSIEFDKKKMSFKVLILSIIFIVSICTNTIQACSGEPCDPYGQGQCCFGYLCDSDSRECSSVYLYGNNSPFFGK